jgi:c-di-GMP-binding flagellar brake protein YcgR
MLERTFSFWRRLVGKSKSDKPVATHHDRRLWTRYPSDLHVTVRDASTAEAAPIEAQVRDISLGGANLITDRPFETGQILTLELPRRDAAANDILACVVRVVSEKPGEWSLGCVFSRELTDEDMANLGANRERHVPSDQRTWVRVPCNCTVRFEKVGDPTNRSWNARVLNLSANGIGVTIDEPVNAGALLNLELRNQADKLIKTILACVVHVTRQTAGGWAVGCNFIRQLSERDLEELV